MSYKIGEDTVPVRKGEELDNDLLERYLRAKIDGLPEAPFEMLQFPAGHSNLTYQLKIGEWEAVLRRPPLGPVAPKAHDMKREHFIISELHPHFPPAPKPILFSDDVTIVGSPFFIMERKHGLVFDTSFPEGFEATEKNCRKLSEIMVDKLVELHSIPYQETRLASISKPTGFIERQVEGWISRYLRAKTDEIPEVEPLLKWLTGHIPSQGEATIIHYDYKLNNAMFNEDVTEMVGLFDWEMTTVGDPLADLGVAMGYWTEKNDPTMLKTGLGKPSVTVNEGFMTRKQFIEAYAKKSGRDVSDIGFYLTFAYFKLAVICQQIYYRYQKGQTNDPRFSHFNSFVRSLVIHGASIAER
ncbi:phosphotransferase family protein [Bacillus sp. V59.32b]|uniref:phosphotransferase family protein n=1 Tax=Bacillus sp. V59.32b TaxID=1758642 RepID=UPI000E3C3EE2|nr:phosphotransferase family protein [Bacillus sp. V59.32b]RFU69944.1 phosphotransferase family protein [Bacillus sp. V59.32b]